MRAYRKRYREQKYFYGDYAEINIYPVYEYPKAGRRKRIRKPSKACQVKLNQKNAERQLNRIIGANFTNEDYKLELTYSDEHLPDSLERAKKDLCNFFGKLRRLRKKLGLSELKYIWSVEVGSRKGRIHFHLIINGGIALKDIQKKWGKGYVDKVKPLMFDETGVQGIAKYFCKQKLSEDGSIDGKYQKRYQCSLNCIKPEPKCNDFKYTKRKVTEIADDCENRRMIEALYSGYFCAECKPFWNEMNGEHYLTIMLYKKTADIDLRLRRG